MYNLCLNIIHYVLCVVLYYQVINITIINTRKYKK
jgi:hypothetical protein